jgi:hypothetical protein
MKQKIRRQRHSMRRSNAFSRDELKRLAVISVLIFSGFFYAYFALTHPSVLLSPPDFAYSPTGLFYFFLAGLFITLVVFMVIIYYILHSDEE